MKKGHKSEKSNHTAKQSKSKAKKLPWTTMPSQNHGTLSSDNFCLQCQSAILHANSQTQTKIMLNNFHVVNLETWTKLIGLNCLMFFLSTKMKIRVMDFGAEKVGITRHIMLILSDHNSETLQNSFLFVSCFLFQCSADPPWLIIQCQLNIACIHSSIHSLPFFKFIMDHPSYSPTKWITQWNQVKFHQNEQLYDRIEIKRTI